MRLFRKILTGIILSSVAIPLLAVVSFRTDVYTLQPGFITANTSAVDFGDVSLGTDNQRTVFIYNGTADTVNIATAVTTNPVFSTSQWTVTTLLPLDSAGIGVTFTPDANIVFQAFLLTEILNCDRPIVIPLSGNGQAESYYALTFNKYGEDLKAVMPSLFPGKIDLGYNGGRAAMYGYIDNHNDSLTGVYTGFTQYWAYGSSGTFPNPINCEHTWPQSFFNEASPMKGDINHLFPTHMDPNGVRSNYPFGNATQSVTWQQAGSKLGHNSYGETVFEPRDVHKGDAARAIFYFVTRYGNMGGYLGAHQEADLHEWYWSDPVSQKEIDRNNGIYERQHNRNPFIDHPEFLDRISSFYSNATVATAPDIAVAPQTLNYSLAATDTIYLEIANSGNAALQIGGISENATWLSAIGAFPHSIATGEKWPVALIFTPDAGAGDYSGVIQVNSNDPAQPTIERSISFHHDPNDGIAVETVPQQYQLIKAYPNPFNAMVTLSATLSAASETQIQLFDLRGHLLQTWMLPPGQGSREIVWNAHDKTGTEVSSGIYLVYISQGGRTNMQRLALLR